MLPLRSALVTTSLMLIGFSGMTFPCQAADLPREYLQAARGLVLREEFQQHAEALEGLLQDGAFMQAFVRVTCRLRPRPSCPIEGPGEPPADAPSSSESFADFEKALLLEKIKDMAVQHATRLLHKHRSDREQLMQYDHVRTTEIEPLSSGALDTRRFLVTVSYDLSLPTVFSRLVKTYSFDYTWRTRPRQMKIAVDLELETAELQGSWK